MTCPECQRDFTPKRPHQRFCSNACRVNNHHGSDGGLRGAVTSVRKMKRGVVSVVVRFTPLEAAAALKLTPGEIVEIEGIAMGSNGSRARMRCNAFDDEL